MPGSGDDPHLRVYDRDGSSVGTEPPEDIAGVGGGDGGSGVSDHGDLSGLSDDDQPQYVKDGDDFDGQGTSEFSNLQSLGSQSLSSGTLTTDALNNVRHVNAGGDIQAALDEGPGRIIIHEGTDGGITDGASAYSTLSNTHLRNDPIEFESNQVIEMRGNTTIAAKDDSNINSNPDNNYLIQPKDPTPTTENVAIIGDGNALVHGNAANNDASGANVQSGCISIRNCRNARIQGLRSVDPAGFHILKRQAREFWVDRIRFDRIDTGRDAISGDNARRYVVSNCQAYNQADDFSAIGGTDEFSGEATDIWYVNNYIEISKNGIEGFKILTDDGVAVENVNLVNNTILGAQGSVGLKIQAKNVTPSLGTIDNINVTNLAVAPNTDNPTAAVECVVPTRNLNIDGVRAADGVQRVLLVTASASKNVTVDGFFHIGSTDTFGAFEFADGAHESIRIRDGYARYVGNQAGSNQRLFRFVDNNAATTIRDLTIDGVRSEQYGTHLEVEDNANGGVTVDGATIRDFRATANPNGTDRGIVLDSAATYTDVRFGGAINAPAFSIPTDREIRWRDQVQLAGSPTASNYGVGDAGTTIIDTSTSPADEYRVLDDGSLVGPL